MYIGSLKALGILLTILLMAKTGEISQVLTWNKYLLTNFRQSKERNSGLFLGRNSSKILLPTYLQCWDFYYLKMTKDLKFLFTLTCLSQMGFSTKNEAFRHNDAQNWIVSKKKSFPKNKKFLKKHPSLRQNMQIKW